ncbi:MAG: N-acetylmuramoyl-L-alanine amidase [Alistipes sp.]|nr:N-acetylmuramoyl-L-alanine amidase [Alistipes sp.]
MKRLFWYVILAFFISLRSEVLFAQTQAEDTFVIVIDAGHGGRAFPGATYGGVMEKDINLAVALKLGALIEKELPYIKVVYTRKTDTALGATLNEDLTARANIANRAEGDFFISIHANAATKSTVYGPETLIMGESEKETRYNESALYNNNKEELIDMSDENTAAMVRAYIQNLQFTYGEYSEMMARIMQSQYSRGGRNARKTRRQLLKVLYATDMPSVLTELGFMTNPQELAYMKSQKGQNELARMLFNSVKEYVGYIERMSGKSFSVAAANDAASQTTSTAKQTASTEAQKTASTTTRNDSASVATQSSQSDDRGGASTAQKSAAKATATKSSAGYTIQIMASPNVVNLKDSQFKSYSGKVRRLEGAGASKYKYCYGEFATREEAQSHLATVRKSFKDAFIVRYNGGKVVK